MSAPEGYTFNPEDGLVKDAQGETVDIAEDAAAPVTTEEQSPFPNMSQEQYDASIAGAFKNEKEHQQWLGEQKTAIINIGEFDPNKPIVAKLNSKIKPLSKEEGLVWFKDFVARVNAEAAKIPDDEDEDYEDTKKEKKKKKGKKKSKSPDSKDAESAEATEASDDEKIDEVVELLPGDLEEGPDEMENTQVDTPSRLEITDGFAQMLKSDDPEAVYELDQTQPFINLTDSEAITELQLPSDATPQEQDYNAWLNDRPEAMLNDLGQAAVAKLQEHGQSIGLQQGDPARQKAASEFKIDLNALLDLGIASIDWLSRQKEALSNILKNTRDEIETAIVGSPIEQSKKEVAELRAIDNTLDQLRGLTP
ncbi:MAG: hypothetical protein HQ530_02245 [Parcubacteria group bacterium]|nr:hypothetical protein [Parcubacteria group bacterium]